MDKVIVVLCVVVLAMTAVDGYDRLTGGNILGGGNEDSKMSSIKSVTVPEPRLGDEIYYDHEILIEYRYENKTSGDYSFWALDVGGTQDIEIVGTTTMKDGFGEQHDVMYLKRQLGAQFTVNADSSDDEPITANGEYDIKRDEYTDLSEDRIVFTEADAWLKVEELPNTNIPLEFDGYMRSYFDPEEEDKETLEESVLGDDRYIELGDNGTYDYAMGEFWSIEYQWEAQQGEIISGYETIFINVTTDFGDENFSLPFQEALWYTNDVSVPVRQYIVTSTYYEDDEVLFYFIIENDFTLQANGFTPGDKEILWDTCGGSHWYSQHPTSEFESWYSNYMPMSGSGFDESSFDFKPEDAMAYLTTKDSATNEYPSPGLKTFLDSYDDIIVTRAEYSAEKDTAGDPQPEKKQGEYWWNLTFGHKRTDDDRGTSSRNLPYRYQLLVKQTSTSVLVPEPHYDDEWEVEEDYGIINGTSPFMNRELNSVALTMTSCENIMKTDDKVIEFFYTRPSGIEDDELSWGEVEGTGFTLEVSSWSAFGMDMIATLTGIETQTTSEYYWTLSKEDLLEGGTMASASVDAQTGRLISILYLKGTALQGAFSED
ncbi:MAG: hypothetical protein JSW00_12630 [Thermoplasmata archaeon]|nr:MAG: hypothetical protein JSW00_12630 [Thermoplasmata archaeon]